MHVRVQDPLTKVPSTREFDLPVYHVSLTIQADSSPSQWLQSVIQDSLEEDEYVRIKDIHEIYLRDTSVEHHGGFQPYAVN